MSVLGFSARTFVGLLLGDTQACGNLAVAGAAAIGGALWTVRPELTFFVAAVLGAVGTLWAAVGLPSRPPVREV